MSSENNPCWRGYHLDPKARTKMKGGKQVPNCIPIDENKDQTIECKKCGWRWKLSDGGKDLYVCHKCGFDNTDEYDKEGVNLAVSPLKISLGDLLKEIKEISKGAFEDFAKTRLGGAEKITDNAKKKGGLAMLTYHHFYVKLPYYKKAEEGKLDLKKAEAEYKALVKELYTATKSNMQIEQIAFQKLVGKIEVLGELLIKHK